MCEVLLTQAAFLLEISVSAFLLLQLIDKGSSRCLSLLFLQKVFKHQLITLTVFTATLHISLRACERLHI